MLFPFRPLCHGLEISSSNCTSAKHPPPVGFPLYFHGRNVIFWENHPRSVLSPPSLDRLYCETLRQRLHLYSCVYCDPDMRCMAATSAARIVADARVVSDCVCSVALVITPHNLGLPPYRNCNCTSTNRYVPTFIAPAGFTSD